MTTYALGGLVVESEFELPDLSACDVPCEDVDVRIRRSLVDAPHGSAPAGSWLVAEPEGPVFAWEGLPLIRLIAGREVHVESRVALSPDVERELHACLLGPVLSMVLLQRGLYPLHASATVIEGAALAFAAVSGSGKSTLAAACLERGHELLSDDVTALECGAAAVRAHPGRPVLKLSPASWISLGQDPTGLPVVDAEDDKRARPMGAGFHPEAVPLAGILLLEEGPANRLERLAPREAMLAVLRNCHRLELAVKAFGHETLMARAARVAERVPVHRLVRPKSFDHLDAVVDLVAEHVRAGAGHDRP